MAAIPTIAFDSSFTGFAASGGTFSLVGGEATPDNFGADSTLIWDTAYQETSAPDQGIITKWTFGGGCEAGTEYHLIYNYLDANNYRYIKVWMGSLIIFSDVSNDTVQLWKVVGGSHSQVSGDTPLRYTQPEAGDLRLWKFVSGSDVTMVKIGGMHIVKFTAQDSIEPAITWNTDIIVLRELETPDTVNGKVGFTSIGGSHTTTISLLQANLISAYYTNGNVGNDSNAGTSLAAPFATVNKLMQTVDVNEIGFMRAKTGGYAEDISNLTNTYKNGTSYEDAPTFLPYGTDAVRQVGAPHCYYMKASTSLVPAQYRVLCGWEWDGNFQDEHSFLWGQLPGDNVTHQHHHMRFQEIYSHHGKNVGFAWHNPTFYTGSAPFDKAPVAGQYESYPHWLDCRSEHNDNLNPPPTINNSHGYYINASYVGLDYCQGNFNRGAGGKFAHGTANGPFGLGVFVVNHCRNRFFRADNNGLNGFNTERGIDNICLNGMAWDCGVGYSDTGANTDGWMIGLQAVENYAINCVAYGCQQHGFLALGFFGSLTDSGFINCTAYGNQWNFGTATNSTFAVDGSLFMNCTSHQPGALHYRRFGGFDTNTTFTKNHETANSGTGFGSIFGDPKFVSIPTNNFRLDPSSPLIDAGANASAYTTIDLERRPRPQEVTKTGVNAWDIGAYELAGTSTSALAARPLSSALLVNDIPGIVINAPINVVPGAQTVTTFTQTEIPGVEVICEAGNLASVRLTVTKGILTVTAQGGVSIT